MADKTTVPLGEFERWGLVVLCYQKRDNLATPAADLLLVALCRAAPADFPLWKAEAERMPEQDRRAQEQLAVRFALDRVGALWRRRLETDWGQVWALEKADIWRCFRRLQARALREELPDHFMTSRPDERLEDRPGRSVFAAPRPAEPLAPQKVAELLRARLQSPLGGLSPKERAAVEKALEGLDLGFVYHSRRGDALAAFMTSAEMRALERAFSKKSQLAGIFRHIASSVTASRPRLRGLERRLRMLRGVLGAPVARELLRACCSDTKLSAEQAKRVLRFAWEALRMTGEACRRELRGRYQQRRRGEGEIAPKQAERDRQSWRGLLYASVSREMLKEGLTDAAST